MRRLTHPPPDAAVSTRVPSSLALPADLRQRLAACQAWDAISAVSRALTSDVWAGVTRRHARRPACTAAAVRTLARETAAGLAAIIPVTAPDEWWAPRVTERGRAVLDQVDDPEDALTAAGPHADWPFYLRGLLVSDPMGVCWYSFPTGCVSIADLLLGALHAAQEEPREARALIESDGDRYLEPELLDRLVRENGCWADGALDAIMDDRRGVFAAAGEPYSVIPLYGAYVAGMTGNPFLDDDGDEAGYIFVPWEIERLALVRDLHAEALASVARMQALTEALDTRDGQERFLGLLASAFPPHT